MEYRRLTTLTFIILSLGAASACFLPQGPAIEILGLRIGMEKAAAHTRLNEMSEFVRNEGRNQEIWKVKDASRFAEVAIGYSEDKIRYVTAFVDKAQANELIPFSGVGDLRSAKAEIMEPHYRYIWDIPASDGDPACSVNVYGDNPDFITIYTLAERTDARVPGETESEEENDD